VNPEILVSGEIVICGTRDEVSVLFCILAQYGIGPDRYICPGQELSEIYGTPCPDDDEIRCYIKFSTNDDIPVGAGSVFVYTPYGKEEDSGCNQLLLAKGTTLKGGIPEVLVTKDVVQLNRFSNDSIVDIRPINERGIYLGRKSDGKFASYTTSKIEVLYAIGKAMYEKMKKKGGRFMITAFYPMGDNYRWLAKYEGVDYSDVTYVVTETARDLPGLMGVNGYTVSRGEIGCIRMYLAMNYHEDKSVMTIPYAPLYPGIMFHGDLATQMLKGVARRTFEPALSLMDPITDVNKRMKRAAIEVPRSVLLNPYGKSIWTRTAKERESCAEVMLGLAKKFSRRGYLVFTNTPFPDQVELPGTKRYEGDITTTISQASSFDLVVTIFTGFMETVIYSDCNLLVLRYSDSNSRKWLASSLGRKNYWEINVLSDKPKTIVSKIIELFDEMDVGKKVVKTCKTERLLPIEEKAEIFKDWEINPLLNRTIFFTCGKNEVRKMLAKGRTNPLLCSLGAFELEKGYNGPVDYKKSILWYRRAVKNGATGFSGDIRRIRANLDKGIVTAESEVSEDLDDE